MKRNELCTAVKNNPTALQEVKEIAKKQGVSWPNLPTEILAKAYDKAVTKHCCKKSAPKASNNKCVDDGARKAILAIAKILNLKNIEKNF